MRTKRILPASSSLIAQTLLLALVAGLGCSTSYPVRPSPRIAVGMSGGQLQYIKHGVPADDISGATRGVPEAEELAHAARANKIAGFVTMMVGSIAPAVMLPFLIQADRDRVPLILGVGTGVTVGASFTGAFLMSNGQALELDAVNAYNDAVDRGAAR